MKFGVREITDIVFKASANNQKLGTATYDLYDPILFFDSAKTSTVEGAVATVYAQGGRGNPRLLAWDGDKTVTFTFEDALMTPYTFAALSGADLFETQTAKLHLTEKSVSEAGTEASTSKIEVDITAITGAGSTIDIPAGLLTTSYIKVMLLTEDGDIDGLVDISAGDISYAAGILEVDNIPVAELATGATVLVDFYAEADAKQLEISAGKFAGYYYVEANTLFRGLDGKDYPAQFTIPKAKIQSNFTFTMAPTGDPSTFTFTLDAFPAPTRFDSTKKVMFTLDVFDQDPSNNI